MLPGSTLSASRQLARGLKTTLRTRATPQACSRKLCPKLHSPVPPDAQKNLRLTHRVRLRLLSQPVSQETPALVFKPGVGGTDPEAGVAGSREDQHRLTGSGKVGWRASWWRQPFPEGVTSKRDEDPSQGLPAPERAWSAPTPSQIHSGLKKKNARMMRQKQREGNRVPAANTMAFPGQPGAWTAVPTPKPSASCLRGHLPWLPSQTDSIQRFLFSRKWCRLDTELSAADSASSVIFVPQ